MRHFGKLTAWMAAGALLLGAGFAQAAEPPLVDAKPVDPVPLAMDAIEMIGLKPGFEALNLKLYGWIEMSYTYNNNGPSDHRNNGRVFDSKTGFTFNQLAVNLERPLKEGNDFDFGGKLEFMFGGDTRFTHANGLFQNITGDEGSSDPAWYSLDLLQFYGTVRLPVGNGLVVKFGRFVTPHGAEVIDAPTNAFYSHSFLFNYAIPFTHLGVQLDYAINDKLSVYYAAVQGWDTFDDNNDTWSNMVGASIKWTDSVTQYVNVITGPERTDENTDYRTVVDTTLTWQVTKDLSLSLNADYGNESGTAVAGATGNNWYGVASYASLVLVPQVVNFNLRAEYFRDSTGSRIFAVTPAGLPIGATEVVEITAGLDIHPIKKFQNLRVRPEIRWDHSLGDDLFDTPADPKNDQVTFAADVIITF